MRCALRFRTVEGEFSYYPLHGGIVPALPLSAPFPPVSGWVRVRVAGGAVTAWAGCRAGVFPLAGCGRA
jgi:hypothetical protein